MNVIKMLFLLSTLVLSTSLFAKRFTSQYCEFELPPGWSCVLEGTEWVCQSENKERKKEAIIILAAKIRGQLDSLDQYYDYLKKTKTFSLPGGKRQISEAKYAKYKKISDHRWVDSLHLASEVPGFYTRYLATVKEDLGVAVTFSVSKDHYSAYQDLFDKMVASLKVFRQKMDSPQYIRKGTKEENLLGGSTYIPAVDDQYDIAYQKSKRGKSKGSASSYLFFILLALGVGGFILWKKKSQKGKKKGKK